MKHLSSFILIVILWGCSPSSSVDKHLRHSDNVMDVKGLVREIVIDTPLVGGGTRPYIIDKYFILADHQSSDKQVLIFNKKDFSYITGTGHPGEGPDEIATIGVLIPDEKHRRLYVTHYGKNQITGYKIDSILSNPDYLPEYKIGMKKTTFPDRFYYVDDTLCYSRCIIVEPGKTLQQSLVKWNMKTGDIHPLINGHPEIERKRIQYDVSLENNLIAVSYDHHDLLATYDLEGHLKHYIYGPFKGRLPY